MLDDERGHHPGDDQRDRTGGVTAMELTEQERNLLLSGLYHLSNAQAQDVENSGPIEDLVEKLGGDPDATFFLLEHG
jgi:hypothetical protein